MVTSGNPCDDDAWNLLSIQGIKSFTALKFPTHTGQTIWCCRPITRLYLIECQLSEWNEKTKTNAKLIPRVLRHLDRRLNDRKTILKVFRTNDLVGHNQMG